MKLLQPHLPLAPWSNGDQMVYAVNAAYLEIGQGASSPMRGWGMLAFLGLPAVGGYGLLFDIELSVELWSRFGWSDEGVGLATLVQGLFSVAVFVLSTWLFWVYFAMSFLTVTDPVVRLDHKRQKVWMWTGKGPIEMDWAIWCRGWNPAWRRRMRR
ncbi:MAG: hypothetical protein AB1666_14825 [Pseudomonadota bacterium]